jgi:hypothetical protein
MTQIDAQKSVAAGTHRGASLKWTVAGSVTLLTSVALYATDLSRSVAGWIAPLGVTYFALGTWGLITGRRIPRWIVAAVVIATMAIVVLGIATYIYATWIAHPNDLIVHVGPTGSPAQ